MLNKSKLLAGVAVVGAVVSTGVFAADGKGAVYGDIRWSLDQADASGTAPSYTATNNNSYYGIKGSITEGQLTAFGGYERTLDNDGAGADTTRQGYFGLKCDTFGTLQFGQFATAYMESGRKLDPFYNTTVAGIAGPGASNSYGLSATLTAETLGSGFIDNQVAYTTPSFGGLTVNAAVFMLEGTGSTTGDHDYALGAEYSNAGISVGVQALDVNNLTNFGVATTGSAVRVYGGFNVAQFGVNISAEKVDGSGVGGATDYVFASGWFGVTPATRLALALGKENNDSPGGAGGVEGDSVSLGVFHDVVKNFTGWVAARHFDATGVGGQADVITLGASYKFNLGFGS